MQCWWGSEVVQTHWRAIWQAFKILNTKLPCDLAILLVNAQLTTLINIKTRRFKAALFIIVKKQIINLYQMING